MSKQKQIYITILLTLGFIIPINVQAATFSFDPETASYIQGCTYNVDVLIDTEGSTSNSADIIINFDPNEVEIIDSDLLNTGIQITPGNAYTSYFGNQVDILIGEIRLTGVNLAGNFNGEEIFGSFEFKSQDLITSADFDIYMTGVGPEVSLDSNIASSVSSNDLLSGVTNGSYTFITGSCIPDNSPPIIAFITPQNGQTGVPVTSDIQINIQDADSGIDLSEVIIIFNGVTYDMNDSRFTYTGTESNYIITIDPSENFPVDISSTITVIAKDNSGNSAESSITFNTPETPEDTEAPVVTFLHPTDGETIPVTDQISIRISDIDNDVDINSIEITLNGIIYTILDNEFTYIEDGDGYIIYLQPSFPLPDNEMSSLSIFSKDNLGNTSINSITFNIPIVIPIKEDNIITQIEDIIAKAAEVTTQFISESEELTVGAALATITVIAPTAIVGTTVAIIEIPLLIQRFLFGILGFLGIRKKGRNFGYVYDSITKAPLSLAIVRFYNNVGKLIQTEVTSSYGQFNTEIDDGEYRLVVSKSAYKFPSRYVIGNTDGPIANIYHGQLGQFKETDISSLSIPMDPLDRNRNTLLYRFMKAFRFIWNTTGFLLFSIGFIQSIMHLLSAQTTLNIIIFFIYLLLLILLVLKVNPFKRNVGIIYKERKKQAGVGILLKKLGEDKVLDHRFSDEKGKYHFIVTPGSYKIELANEETYTIRKGDTFINRGNKPTVFGRKIDIK
jgi:hypothetical protein